MLSIVIPAYNEEKYIGECLENLTTSISYVREPCEIIVVDNTSTDSTAEIVSNFFFEKNIHWIDWGIVTELRKGITLARQAGFLASKGDLIANIDADTKMPKDWVTLVLKEFDQRPKMIALSGPTFFCDLNPYQRFLVWIFNYIIWGTYHLLSLFHYGSQLQGGNYIVRREAFQKIGGFDLNIPFYGEDADIAKRISKIGYVRWTWKLSMLASGRRLQTEGIMRIGFRYALNFCWVTIFDKPFTFTYKDIR